MLFEFLLNFFFAVFGYVQLRYVLARLKLIRTLAEAHSHGPNNTIYFDKMRSAE